jgi:hypothetical protein
LLHKGIPLGTIDANGVVIRFQIETPNMRRCGAEFGELAYSGVSAGNALAVAVQFCKSIGRTGYVVIQYLKYPTPSKPPSRILPVSRKGGRQEIIHFNM